MMRRACRGFPRGNELQQGIYIDIMWGYRVATFGELQSLLSLLIFRPMNTARPDQPEPNSKSNTSPSVCHGVNHHCSGTVSDVFITILVICCGSFTVNPSVSSGKEHRKCLRGRGRCHYRRRVCANYRICSN